MHVDDFRELIGLEEASYQKIELFPLDNVRPNSFEAFLIKSRVHLFLKLYVLTQYWEVSFYPCFPEFSLYEWTVDEEDEAGWEVSKTYGPTVIMQKISGQEIFNDFLSRTGVQAIDTPGNMQLTGERNAIDGPIDYTLGKESQSLYPEYFISEDGSIIIGENNIYVVDGAEKIQKIVDTHREQFSTFVAEYKDSFVPHTVYIDWLLTWFPGKVRVRSIGNPSHNI